MGKARFQGVKGSRGQGENKKEVISLRFTVGRKNIIKKIVYCKLPDKRNEVETSTVNFRHFK